MSAGAAGRTALGIELGSTRIKACLVDADQPTRVLATGIHHWENELVGGLWTYPLESVISGVQNAFARLVDDAQSRTGFRPADVTTIGVSAMMHGYLPLDGDGELLVPFRTWRNTNTSDATAELGEHFGVNIPHRWSVAHVRQAILDGEAHVPEIRSLTTLAGYVHRRLTGRHVLGVGDASGMFPIDTEIGDYDASMLSRFASLDGGFDLRAVLPEVLVAGADAGALTQEGALFLDPTGRLKPGITFCPPEGDAGTGMVATNAVAPRTGNVSVGTSVFAMVVLEHPLDEAHEEIDLVTTPSGHPVAMVHCNNGASELDAWASVFGEYARATGADSEPDAVFAVLLQAALEGETDAGGILVFNQLAGEPVIGLREGRPLVLRTPSSTFTLANFMRAQVYGIFAALSTGLQIIGREGVALDQIIAHGGLFRTAGAAQRMLAGILNVPVGVAGNASEGGAWGMAVLAAYRGSAVPLEKFLDDVVFGASPSVFIAPDPLDVVGFGRFLERYDRALPVEALAAEVAP